MKKVDYEFVTLYVIRVKKVDHTGYYKHYLSEEQASIDFWKALKENFYLEITIEKEKHLIADLPEEIRKRVHAERIAREKLELEQEQATPGQTVTVEAQSN